MTTFQNARRLFLVHTIKENIDDLYICTLRNNLKHYPSHEFNQTNKSKSNQPSSPCLDLNFAHRYSPRKSTDLTLPSTGEPRAYIPEPGPRCFAKFRRAKKARKKTHGDQSALPHDRPIHWYIYTCTCLSRCIMQTMTVAKRRTALGSALCVRVYRQTLISNRLII